MRNLRFFDTFRISRSRLRRLDSLACGERFGVIGLVDLDFRGKAREVRFGKLCGTRFFARCEPAIGKSLVKLAFRRISSTFANAALRAARQDKSALRFFAFTIALFDGDRPLPFMLGHLGQNAIQLILLAFVVMRALSNFSCGTGPRKHGAFSLHCGQLGNKFLQMFEQFLVVHSHAIPFIARKSSKKGPPSGGPGEGCISAPFR